MQSLLKIVVLAVAGALQSVSAADGQSIVPPARGAAAASQQNATVPPPTQAGTTGEALGFVNSVRGATMSGVEATAHAVGDRVAKEALEGRGIRAYGGGLQVGEYALRGYDAWRRDDAAAKDELIQDVVTHGVTEGISYGLHAANPALGYTWDVSTAVGSLVRSLPYDARNTVGDKIDDFTFRNFAEPIINYQQTGYFDPLSDEAVAAEIAKRRERMRRQFRETQIRNEAAAASQPASSVPAAPAQTGADNSALIGSMLLNGVLTGAQIYRGQRSTQAPVAPFPAAPAAACNKTYNTPDGCHPGHDEKSHPGGCRC